MSVDTAYQAQRRRLSNAVAARVLASYSLPQEQAIAEAVQFVEAGQRQTVALVEAYLATKSVEAIGRGSIVGLEPDLYTTSTLRGVPASEVYARPFTVMHAALERGDEPPAALKAAQTAGDKLARTDLQLVQTHSARDWMVAAQVVGYRRVLTGPGPHCTLCTLASTRTYRASDLMAIHEHCTCTVEPLWGTEPVASVGTTVRIDHDPELGPRLMADDWSPTGPRLL